MGTDGYGLLNNNRLVWGFMTTPTAEALLDQMPINNGFHICRLGKSVHDLIISGQLPTGELKHYYGESVDGKFVCDVLTMLETYKFFMRDNRKLGIKPELLCPSWAEKLSKKSSSETAAPYNYLITEKQQAFLSEVEKAERIFIKCEMVIPVSKEEVVSSPKKEV
jgi:hypothetical protein